jgi:hypothetical protein
VSSTTWIPSVAADEGAATSEATVDLVSVGSSDDPHATRISATGTVIHPRMSMLSHLRA